MDGPGIAEQVVGVFTFELYPLNAHRSKTKGDAGLRVLFIIAEKQNPYQTEPLEFQPQFSVSMSLVN